MYKVRINSKVTLSVVIMKITLNCKILSEDLISLVQIQMLC